MELIHKYFPGLEEEKIHKLSQLEPLYIEWNSKINLVSRKDLPHLYERHILHSLSVCKFFSFNSSCCILDVGTGGGFPGIPLAIMFPEAQFTLVDSTGKKIRVVEDVIRQIGLKNCRALQARAENLKEKYHFVVSRAVTNFNDFAKLVRNRIIPGQVLGTPNGIIYLKGGDFENEIRGFKDKVEIFLLRDHFEEEFFTTKKIIYLKFN